MVIERKIVSYILKTPQENIERMFEEGDQIKVVLYEPHKIICFTKKKYRNAKKKLDLHQERIEFEKLKEKKHKEHEEELKRKAEEGEDNYSIHKILGVLLGILGGLMILGGLSMDTTVRSDYGRVHNIGKQQDQTLVTMLGGMSFLGGIILFVMDKGENNKKQD